MTIERIIRIVCPDCRATNRLLLKRLTEHPKCGKCQNSLFKGAPLVLDQALFEHHLKNDNIPLLVDFWAEWCGPCKMMAPSFESATKMLEPQVRLIKINTEINQALSTRYAIQSIPTLMLFANGKSIARNSGVMGTLEIVQWVKQYI